jgi:hypothetical protein
MIKGSSPIQLSQLDINPAIQAGAMEQQAAVNLNNTLQTSILEFAQKQEEKRVKKNREAQINTFMPTFLENMGIDIPEGTPEYSSLIKYINNTSGGDIMSVLKTMGDIPIASVTAKGFEPEFPIPYMIPYDDGGTPDDPSDDTEATRVQVTTVSKDPGGLTYGDGTPVRGGDQVFTDPQTGAIKKLDATTMFPMSESGVKNLQARMDDDLKIHREVQEALPKLEAYIDSRGQMSKAGAQRIIDLMQAGLNAFTGEDLTITQRAQALGKAQFRQLLGTLRLDVLGPGVLTEFDRKVIEEAIGGFGPFTTNEMAIEIVQNIANQKLQKGRIAAQDYNLKRSKAGPGTQYFYAPIDMSVYNIKPVFDPTRDLANDFETVEEAEAFAKENNGTIFKFDGKPFQVE